MICVSCSRLPASKCVHIEERPLWLRSLEACRAIARAEAEEYEAKFGGEDLDRHPVHDRPRRRSKEEIRAEALAKRLRARHERALDKLKKKSYDNAMKLKLNKQEKAAREAIKKAWREWLGARALTDIVDSINVTAGKRVVAYSTLADCGRRGAKLRGLTTRQFVAKFDAACPLL